MDSIARHAELAELSASMARHRRSYDELRHTLANKRQALKELQHEYRSVEKECHSLAEQDAQRQVELVRMEKQLETRTAQSDYAIMYHDVLTHMLGVVRRKNEDLRMRAELLQKHIRDIGRETDVVRVAKNDAFHVRRQVLAEKKRLLKRIRERRLERAKQLSNARRQIQQLNTITARRQAREDKRIEVAQQMARELHAAEVKMAKQQVAARHVLENIMDKQDEENEVLTKHLEQGFEQLRAAAGMDDLDEIVKKFLSMGSTVEDLSVRVGQMQKKVDTVRSENAKLRNDLQTARLENVQAYPVQRDVYKDLDAFAKKLSAVEAGKADLEGRTAKTISVLNSVRMCVINLARLSSSDVGEAHDIGLETLPEQLQKIGEKLVKMSRLAQQQQQQTGNNEGGESSETRTTAKSHHAGLHGLAGLDLRLGRNVRVTTQPRVVFKDGIRAPVVCPVEHNRHVVSSDSEMSESTTDLSGVDSSNSEDDSDLDSDDLSSDGRRRRQRRQRKRSRVPPPKVFGREEHKAQAEDFALKVEQPELFGPDEEETDERRPARRSSGNSMLRRHASKRQTFLGGGKQKKNGTVSATSLHGHRNTLSLDSKPVPGSSGVRVVSQQSQQEAAPTEYGLGRVFSGIAPQTTGISVGGGGLQAKKKKKKQAPGRKAGVGGGTKKKKRRSKARQTMSSAGGGSHHLTRHGYLR